MREYPIEAIEALQAQQTPELINGAEVIIKQSPSEPRAGYLDRDELAVMEMNWAAQPNQEPAEKLSPEEEVRAIRDGMGFPNHNLNTAEIYTKFEQLNFDGNEVGLWRYYPRRTQYQNNRPCFVYFHGGGWMGGTPYTVENPCRLIAELADAVVFNVDYSLAPEKKYPNGFQDCFNAVKHIYEHAAEYGIDPRKIAVGGDSAGGNLAAAVSVKDRDLRTGMVALQVLIYPCVTLVNRGIPGYRWDIGEYVIAPEQEKLIDPCLGISRPTDEEVEEIGMEGMYVTREQAFEPYASPMLTDSYQGLPRALCVAAEFDGLRIQDELYAKRLAEAGVPVKAIRYRGLTHAFFDRLGFVPQAEDLCIEIADSMKKMG